LRAFCPEQLERRRRGKQLPEAAPKTTPPVKAPEGVTTVADSGEDPPRSISTRPVAAKRERAPPPAPETATKIDEAEADTISSATLSPPVVAPMRFAAPTVPEIATEADDEDEADALSSTTLSTQEDSGQMETDENKGAKPKRKRKKTPKTTVSEKGKKVRKAEEKGIAPELNPVCKAQKQDAAPESNKLDYTTPKDMGFTVLRRSNRELYVDMVNCRMEEQNPYDLQLEEDSIMVASFSTAEDRRIMQLTPAYYYRLKQGFPQDVGCFLKRPSQRMLRGAFGCTPFQYKEWRKSRDVGCSGPT
jgi:hypothetical protein